MTNTTHNGFRYGTPNPFLHYPTKCDEKNPFHIDILNIKEHPWHMHDQLELIYVLKGSLEFETSIYSSTLNAGDVVCAYYDTIHYIKGKEDNITLVFHFDLDFFSSAVSGIKNAIIMCNSASSVEYDKYYDILRENMGILFACYFNLKTPSKDELLDNCVNLLSLLLNHFSFLHHEGNNIYSDNLIKRNPVQFQRLKRILGYIYENYNKKNHP